MIELIVSEPYEDRVDPALLERACAAALQHEGLPADTDLSIVIEGDEKLHELNKEFLDVDRPTDVLSFPSGEVDPETGHGYLGDIIISYPSAEAQAQAAGHPVEAELQLLVVHGTLHLMGYDHADPQEKQQMWAVQKEILAALGVTLARFSDDDETQ